MDFSICCLEIQDQVYFDLMSPEARRFQPRIVASFNAVQLAKVEAWFGTETIKAAQEGHFESAFAILGQSEADEKGKPITEKGRTRLRSGLDALIVTKPQVDLGNSISGSVYVWQEGSSENDISLRYKVKGPGDESFLELSARSPSLSHSVSVNKNKSPEDNLPGRTIDINELTQQVEGTKKKVEEVRELIHSQLGTSLSPIMGLFMGSGKKVITHEDGSVEEMDWTMDDLMSEWDRRGEEEEREVRKQLMEEVVHGMQHQHNFFFEIEDPDKLRQSEQVRECVYTLLAWVVRSTDNITERYPAPWADTETRSAAEMLEVIRRIILKPAYIIMEGVANSDIDVVPSYEDNFWDTLDERRSQVKAQMRDPNDFEEYQRVKEKVALENPKQYSLEEWQGLLEEEMLYLYEYLQGCADRAVRDYKKSLHFASSLTENGQPLLHPEVKDQIISEIKNVEEIVGQLLKIQSFDQILPWIKERYGPEASYEALLADLGVFPQ